MDSILITCTLIINNSHVTKRTTYKQKCQISFPPNISTYFQLMHPLKKSEICERATPHGAITERCKITLQNVFIHRMNFPPPSGNARSLTIFKRHHFTWLHLKKKNPSLSFLTFGLFPLTSHCPAKIFTEQCLEICITSTSCVCLPFYNVSLIAFLNCKSLWIKASAKWININVHKITMYYSTAPGT